MNYENLIQNICIEYLQILKQNKQFVQKDMARSIGISECLISKWKNYSRKINTEYYKSLELYFTKKEFETCFLKYRNQLLQKIDIDDYEISQIEFWHKLFNGDFLKSILQRNKWIQMLFQIIKYRMHCEMFYGETSLLQDIIDGKSIIVVKFDQIKFYIYLDENDVLIIENERDKKIIHRNDIQKLEYGRLFIYQISLEISNNQLLVLNQYAEIIFNYLYCHLY